MMALAHPGTRVVGVSAVHGNAGVAAVGRNVARVLTLCGAAGVPFFLGAGEPLLAPGPTAPGDWYGSDGLGDAPHAPPSADSVRLQPRPGHAAEHLARAAQVRWRHGVSVQGWLRGCASAAGTAGCARPHSSRARLPLCQPSTRLLLGTPQELEGQLTVVATGPLTNIALAAQVDEGFPQKGGRRAGRAAVVAAWSLLLDACLPARLAACLPACLAACLPAGAGILELPPMLPSLLQSRAWWSWAPQRRPAT